MERHPKKEIQAAIEYALERGWKFDKAGPRAHIYSMAHYIVRSTIVRAAELPYFRHPGAPKTMPSIFVAASMAAHIKLFEER